MNNHTQLFIVHCSLLVALFFPPVILSAQETDDTVLWLHDDWHYDTAPQSLFDLSQYLPSPFNNELRLKHYLRDERFIALRKLYDDTLAVDAIYDRAMLITEGDIRQALLICTIAVLDHQTLGIRIPLLGSIYVPLTMENDSLFRLRRTNLPKKLLDDNLRASDKDKLQHFFGSAFLAYLTNSNSITAVIGDLLELGEDRFVLGGRNDERDQLANKRGREFGLGLLHDHGLLPSDILWGRK
ncbi:MAG: hypothetical protein WCW40_01275 [Bacteroidota bacterium]